MKLALFLRVLWPSFLVTIAQVGVLFTFVDPSEILWLVDAYDVSRQGVYTFGFFLCWAMVSAACVLTLYLTQPAQASEWQWHPRR